MSGTTNIARKGRARNTKNVDSLSREGQTASCVFGPTCHEIQNFPENLNHCAYYHFPSLPLRSRLPSMWMKSSFATFLLRNSMSSSLKAVRMRAHSWATTPRSSAAVLHARTARISSRSLMDMSPSGQSLPPSAHTLPLLWFFATERRECRRKAFAASLCVQRTKRWTMGALACTRVKLDEPTDRRISQALISPPNIKSSFHPGGPFHFPCGKKNRPAATRGGVTDTQSYCPPPEKHSIHRIDRI